MTSRKVAFVSAMMASAAFIVPQQAVAQESGTTATLDTIVITANKRTENLQQAPLAISAISAEQVELQGISEAKDLSALAPNVAVSGGTTNATAAIITIRGIPTPGDETQGYDSPIGLYLDGVYLARSSAASFEVADIERVEVLRGPQGTLFGRNTTGGAINFITRLPGDETSIRLKLGYGNFDQKLARIVADSGVIADSLRLSFGYLHKQRDGVVDNLLQPKNSLDPGGHKTDSFRFAATLDLTENIKLTNIFDWTKITGVPHANQLADVGDGTFRPNVTIGDFTYPQVQPANVAGYLASSTILEGGCGTPLSSVSRARLDPICLEDAGAATDKIWGNMTRIEADFDEITVRSTTAFRKWDNTIRGSDLDGLGTLQGPLFSQATLFNGMPASLIGFVLPPEQAAFAPFIAATPVPTTTQPLFQATNDRRQKQFSQELEVVGGSGTAFEWVVGAFYFKESGREENVQRFAFVLDTNQAVFTDASFGPLGAGFRAANPAQYRAVVQNSTLGYTAAGRSFALYGQGTYRPGGVNGPLGVTLGLRYTWDKKEMNVFQNGLTPFTDPAAIALNDQDASFSEPTGHITVDYRATDDINLYARVARGYRSGGFNARQSTSVANNIALLPFGEEKINSFEAGVKTQFLDRVRLNAAVFYSKYNDLQVTVPIPISGGGSFGTQVVNAGKTDYYGIELEGRFQVNDYLSLDGNFGYVKKDVKQFPSADVNGVLRGIDGDPGIADVIRPGQSPDYTANAGATFTYPLGAGDSQLLARVGWSYVSKQTGFANPLTAPFIEATSSGSRSLLDAQLRIDGLSLGQAKDIGIMFWGKNLTDKEYVSRGIDFGQLGFGSVIFGDPRTFGVSVDMAF